RGIRLHGFLGWLAWLMVHITFMTGFKNRFSALVSWSFAFLGHSRPQQVIDETRCPGRPESAPPGETSAVVEAPTAPREPPSLTSPGRHPAPPPGRRRPGP